VTPAPDALPADIDALRAALAAERLARREAEARAAGAEAMVAHLKLLIAKLRHDKYGASSERGRKILDQLELELEELETAASEDAANAEAAAGAPAGGPGRSRPPRRQPVRGPLPAHLPRERVVVPAPSACPCCGGRLSKLGEDITESVEVVPRRWKVIQTVRERFSCRACERVTQPPAPFHSIARGRAGPGLPAMVLEAKFGQHLPLNRQSETYAREGVELSVSTLADWVGAGTATLMPLVDFIRGRYSGILQADAYAGFGELYAPDRKPGPIAEAACWAHGRRKLFELAEVARAPLAAEAVRRIDAIFEAERAINGAPAVGRLAVRQAHIAPLVADFETWMRAQRGRMSRHAEVGKAMDYMLKRWEAFTRFLADGRICLTNNAAERALRGAALGRRSWLFAGSDRGGERAAAMYSRIVTAKLNDVDPRAWLADVLARIADHPASRVHELLPWHWLARARAAPLALEEGPGRHCCRGRLTMAAPSFAFTIARVAEVLGADEELLHELAEGLEPEDGRLWIYDTDDRATLGFTERGIESLKELLADRKE
jgi:transposase